MVLVHGNIAVVEGHEAIVEGHEALRSCMRL